MIECTIRKRIGPLKTHDVLLFHWSTDDKSDFIAYYTQFNRSTCVKSTNAFTIMQLTSPLFYPQRHVETMKSTKFLLNSSPLSAWPWIMSISSPHLGMLWRSGHYCFQWFRRLLNSTVVSISFPGTTTSRGPVRRPNVICTSCSITLILPLVSGRE